MRKNEETGLLIAMEGLDSSGASTQAILLAGVLDKEGYRVRLTREPTNSLIGGLIRAQLTGEWKASPECRELLFAADRANHLEGEIMPALEAGKVVVTDRYAFSSIAYGSIEVESAEWLKALNSQFVLPDLTFIVNVNPKTCALRMKQSYYEVQLYNEEQRLTKVWQAYEQIAKEYPNVHIIDGEREEAEILEEIAAITRKALGNVRRK